MKKIYTKENIEIITSNELINYAEAIKFMEDRVRKIICNKDRELIWFLNHDHMYTTGTSSDENEILTHSNVPIIKTNRGGKTTYHGPGQRIVYFLINLNNSSNRGSTISASVCLASLRGGRSPTQGTSIVSSGFAS